MKEMVVFVIDDEPVLLVSITSLLRIASFTVQAFASAEEFLSAYTPGQPGCLLLDVRLTGMSGIQLQRRLRSDRIDLPVILMSGHATAGIRDLGMAEGAVDFLEKPIEPQKLIELVKACLDRLGQG